MRRKTTVFLFTLAIVSACGQETPPGTDGTSTSPSTETGDPVATSTGSADDTSVMMGGEYDSYYPLIDGASWTYVATNSMGQATGTEIVDAVATEWDGKTGVVLTDNPNGNGEFTQSTIVRDGTIAYRVHKVVGTQTQPNLIVDYTPGFTRFDDAWTDVGVKGERVYVRVESDGDGLNPDTEDRGHTYEVTAVDEEVTVAAGTFSCIVVERTRTTGATAGERVVFWYAKGVGKVREERPADNRIEELIAVSIPGGVVLP
ncbi:MAG: hypothetical protein JKY37_19585 [Nannocystaceae bacterium]|nr:hypothetical protein [Nannocystaceae bacterium]